MSKTYKERCGFIRRCLLKIITKIEKVSFFSGFTLTFHFFNKLHFLIYTRERLSVAIKNKHLSVFGATDRFKRLCNELYIYKKYSKCTTQALNRLNAEGPVYINRNKHTFISMALAHVGIYL